ncbi:hypothetical protein J2X20_001847 [Pelomonas saccharophila]|uniref:DUF1631 domain-containing protein n=1 Tax=Roseateles saccharophilus TaxID=304 RepID=A0ABU1YKG2_ROSSA|nr:DUF1631 family protein [Roseateles saccharophilus]MDR7269218.1 hypothetical protein [Roseateles saccharophilus]
MPFSPHPHDLLDHALTEAGPLARDLLNSVQDELDAQPQHFPLREAWRKVRAHFVTDFEGRLIELLQAGRRGDDPLHRAPAQFGGLESLSLVDEQQALQDVAIAHVAHAAEELSRAELHQIGNFFAALRGIARARERDNPLRPALFAHALHHALASSPLGAQAQYELMRVAATPLARALNRLYTQACATLHAANISDMVASHGHAQSDPLAHQRLAAARGVSTRPTAHGTLDGLSRRVDAVNSRPQGLSSHGPLTHRDPLAPAPFVRTTGPDMLSRLYDQILADPRLLPPLKALLARLQIAVVRLARTDSMLLRRQDHPTWALLNRVAAHGMVFERADDPRLVDFLRFMEAEAQLLVDAPTPTALLFQQVLARVDAHIDQQARQSSERNAVALAALEREQQRSDWRELIRDQIDHQIAGAPLGPRVHRFLQTAWVDVIVAAMVRHGRDSREAHAAMEMVDAVLDSLVTPRDLADREALRMRLPVLIESLVTGCDSIQLSEVKREPALSELMAQHARLLRGLPALDPSERRPAAPPPASSAASSAPASADEIVKRLMEERDSQVPSHWLSADVDRGELPTVPVQLYNEHDSPDARAALQRWIDGLQIGRWFHLFIQGDWHTAQIAWISEGRQFLLFVGRDSDERLPLTRRALEALLSNGLITALEDDNVVQRAVDTLMSDLDGG